jgi:hypothetical protein
MVAGSHAKLHGGARGRHRQIESVLKLDLLRLRQSERAANVGERFLREDDRAGPNGANRADELNVFDCFGEVVQAAAILFEEAKTRTIDLAVDEETNQAFVTEARCEGQLSLGYVERRFGVAEPSVVQPGDVLERRVAHRGVVSIDVQGAHIRRKIRVIRVYNLSASLTHLLHCAFAVTGLQIHRPHRILHGLYFEPFLDSRQYGLFHTIISRESADDEFFNPSISELRGEICFVES